MCIRDRYPCYLGTEIQSMYGPNEQWQDFQVGQLIKSWVERSVEVWRKGGCKSNVCELKSKICIFSLHDPEWNDEEVVV